MYKKVKLGNGEVFKFIELNTTGHLKDLRKFGSQDFQTLDDMTLGNDEFVESLFIDLIPITQTESGKIVTS